MCGVDELQRVGEPAPPLWPQVRQHGKEVGIVTIMPSADGKSFTFTNTDPRDGSKVTWTGNKTS